MPIRRLLKDAAFGPEEIVTITTAFEGACKAIGLTDLNEPIVEIVAKAVLLAAEHGTGSAEQIQQRALMVMRSSSQLPDQPAA